MLCGPVLFSAAQSFSINTDGSIADTSAILDLKSTTKGFLVPRMTKTQRNDIFSPANGLIIYQSGPDSTGLYYYRDGWKWLSDIPKADSSYWKLSGNTGIAAPSITGITPIDGNYIGTADAKDFVVGVNNIERMRFKANNSFIGLGSTDPQYALDLTLNYDAVSNCVRNGIRMKLPASINAGCEAGYFMGYPNAISGTPAGNDVMFWNFDGVNGSMNNSFRWGFGSDTATGLMMKLKDFRLGIGQTSPLFALDIKTNPDATAPCLMNGIRLTHPIQNQGCNSGIFVGFDPMDSPNGATIWNFGNNGSNQNFLRFGTDDNISNETMRIISRKVGINITNPEATLHIADATATRNGLLVSNPFLTNTGSYFFGSSPGAPYEMEISSTFADPIRFYTNKQASPLLSMTLHNNGNTMVGASTTTPHSTLQVDGTTAVGVTNGVSGGPSGTPVSLSGLGSYISLNAAGGTDNYQLPNAASCAGRIYYIRNTSTTNDATLVTAGGNLCPGNSSTCTASYILPFDNTGKTVIAISDGSNWTIGQIN